MKNRFEISLIKLILKLNIMIMSKGKRTIPASLLLVFTTGLLSMYMLISPSTATAAACPVQTTDFGTVESTVNIPATDDYRIWSRVQIPSASANTYLLQVDDTCFNVGGHSSIATGGWTWIDYHNATTTTKVQMNLTAGEHTVKMIGNKADVMLDRVIFASDLACIPDNNTPVVGGAQPGDTCVGASDTTPPTAVLTSPASGTPQVNGSVNITATAADNESGVDKVEFILNGNTIINTDNTDNKGTYTYAWNTASGQFPDGTYIVTVKSYNRDGLSTISNARSVTVKNTVVQRKPGDANNDNKVGPLDLAIFSFNYGQLSGMTYNDGDFNGDGKVTDLDVAILSFGWEGL